MYYLYVLWQTDKHNVGLSYTKKFNAIFDAGIAQTNKHRAHIVQQEILYAQHNT